VDGGEEIARGFVVAGGDGPELFEFTEEVFDQMALLVEVAVEVGRCKTVWSRRDDRGFAGARQGFADTGIGVKGFVGDQLVGRHLRQQRVGAKEIVGLSRGQQESERIAERIDQSMDFGAQPAAAKSDRLILVFFLGAPALC